MAPSRLLTLLAALALASSACAAADAEAPPTGPVARWSIRDGMLRRSFDQGDGRASETGTWRLSTLSWLQFIAWEEARLRGAAEQAVWVDTPGVLTRLTMARGRVRNARRYGKGERIPEQERPGEGKVLWVVLPDVLVRKVFAPDGLATAQSYPRADVPLHPFIAAQELALVNNGRQRAVLETDRYTCEVVVDRGQVAVAKTTFKRPGDAYALPGAARGAAPTAAPGVAVTAAVAAAPAATPAPARPTAPARPRAATALGPDDEAVLKKVRDLVAQGDGRAALQALGPLRWRMPAPAEVLCLAGRATFLLGRWDEGVRLLADARRAAPGWAEPLVRSAEILTFRGRPTEALAKLETLGPKARSPLADAVGATALLAQRDVVGANRRAGAALLRAPDLAEALIVAGLAAEALGHLTAARDCYVELLAKVPERTVALLPPALAAQATAGGRAGGPALDPLVLPPAAPVLLRHVAAFRLGALHARRSEPAAALAAFRTALAARPDDPPTLLAAGLCAEAAALPGEARDFYRRALDVAPGLKRARERLQALPAGEPSAGAGAPTTAPLDSLFGRLRGAPRPPTGAPSGPPGTVALTALEELEGAAAHPLDPGRRRLPLVRAEAPALVALTPTLRAPGRLPDPASGDTVALTLEGTVDPKPATGALVELTFRPDERSPAPPARAVVRVGAEGGPLSLTLEAPLAPGLPARPLFTVRVALLAADVEGGDVVRRSWRLTYAPTVDATKDEGKRDDESAALRPAPPGRGARGRRPRPGPGADADPGASGAAPPVPAVRAPQPGRGGQRLH